VLDGTLGLLDHHLSTMGIHIEKDYGPVPSVFANHNELSQVFTNLLVNAKDSTSETLSKEKTFGTIQIRTYGDGKNAVVEIRDDGKGISPENMRKLFDPFFTTKEIGKGTGLGLYISLGIVQRLGGKIEAESKLGEGALFRVSLPALNEPAS
jgi:signal transduction histidine kinase